MPPEHPVVTNPQNGEEVYNDFYCPLKSESESMVPKTQKAWQSRYVHCAKVEPFKVLGNWYAIFSGDKNCSIGKRGLTMDYGIWNHEGTRVIEHISELYEENNKRRSKHASRYDEHASSLEEKSEESPPLLDLMSFDNIDSLVVRERHVGCLGVCYSQSEGYVQTVNPTGLPQGIEDKELWVKTDGKCNSVTRSIANELTRFWNWITCTDQLDNDFIYKYSEMGINSGLICHKTGRPPLTRSMQFLRHTYEHSDKYGTIINEFLIVTNMKRSKAILLTRHPEIITNHSELEDNFKATLFQDFSFPLSVINNVLPIYQSERMEDQIHHNEYCICLYTCNDCLTCSTCGCCTD